ncbi:hypothetical protein WDJ51_12945 [Rathayibacter sp. YIM 133350]|uniref:hypothetical protein n=1 Tax=Rathayibacter sp. YIM 133350 TaxID=3131992 RepID=UPI00307E55B8
MNVTEWLLDSDPSIRWQVMRDLTDEPSEAVAAERARVATEGWGAQLLELQDERGYWGGEEYGEDRKSVFWTLHSLRRLGLDPRSPLAREAIERVAANVVWQYWDDLPFFAGEVEPCINGGVLALAGYFGQLGQGSDRILDLLLAERLDDGGWNCDAPQSKRSSFDTTLCVLEGFAEYQRVTGETGDRVTDARRTGEEYLLERNLFRRLSTGEIANGRYVNLSFPPYWFYDVLRSLDYFRTAHDEPDERLAPAIDLLLAQREPDGRWLAGTPWPGEVYFALDAPENEPSRWNTLRALRVLRWYDESLV